MLSSSLESLELSFGRQVDGVHGQGVNWLPVIVGLHPLPRLLLLFLLVLLVFVLVFALATLEQVQDRRPAELLAETGTTGAAGVASVRLVASARLVGRGHCDGVEELTSVGFLLNDSSTLRSP